MKEFQTSTVIRSTPAVVWGILTDADAYPSWNTTFDKLDGRIAPGQKVKLYVKLSPGRAFPVRVTDFEPERRMVWRGGMPIGALFKGERTLQLTPRGDGKVEFSMREVFTGLLAPLITKAIPDMQPAFDEFAACLKAAAEARQATPQ